MGKIENKNKYVLYENYAEIIIHSPKHGEFRVKIDLDDVNKCKEHHWNVSKCSGQHYECFYIITSGKLIHRIIMDAPKGLVVDHINRDPLDNRRVNLRICTNAENRRNNKMHSNNHSGHIGVCWNKPVGKWMAHIMIDGHKKTVGYFINFDDAVKARKDAEIKYHGEFASSS